MSADSIAPQGVFGPKLRWSDMGEHEHFVQFYESQDFLIHSVSGFIGSALVRGDAGVVCATLPHRNAIERSLAALGLDPDTLAAEGRYVPLDAAETLQKLLVGGSIDEHRFHEVAGALMARLERPGRRIRVFGEMVALLVDSGNRTAAVRLEELWNEVAATHKFALFCAYPVGADLDTVTLNAVCRGHGGVIPGESISSLDSADERMRAIVHLQQRALALEEELAKRTQVDQAFLRRLRTARA